MNMRPHPGNGQIFDRAGQRKYVTPAERKRFLACADRAAPPARALAHVLDCTGCRLSEALALGRSQLDAERGELAIRTLKRRRLHYRIQPIPPYLVALLLALPLSADGHFFTWHRATAWRHLRLLMQLAAVDGPAASSRGLRHGFGIRAATCSIPTGITQRWMGHSDSRTTSIYQVALGDEERMLARRMWG